MKKLSVIELDQYIQQEKLDELIDFNFLKGFQEGVYDAVSGQLQTPFPPVKQDLIQLHKYIRKNHFFTVLEFGTGFSTIIIADALQKNQKDFESLKVKPKIRNRFQFQLFSVDSSKEWIEASQQRIPDYLLNRIHLSFSPVEIGMYRHQICTFYKNLPDIIPDFIYVDGPDPQSVSGNINGISFKCWERTIVAGDILLMESTMLPGTHIWFDGRTNNTRFIDRNITRHFVKKWYRQLDITIYQLREEQLGKYNIFGKNLFKKDY